MRIMHLHPGMNLGGGEASIVALVNALSQQEAHEIYLLAADGPMCSGLNSKVRFVPLCSKKFIGQTLELSKALRELRPDVLHIHSVGFGIRLIPSRILMGFRGLIAVTKHARGFKGMPKFMAGMVLKSVANRYVTLSPQIEAELQSVGIAHTKQSIVPHVIDCQDYVVSQSHSLIEAAKIGLGLKKSNYVITIAARLDARKGLLEFVDIIELLLIKNPHVIGLIAGEGDFKTDLVDYVDSKSLNDNIVLAGFQTDIPALLSVSDLVLTMSEEEVLPVFVLEAMAAGTPVVARKLPEFENIINNETDGFVVCGVDEAVSVVSRLIKDTAFACQIGAAAKERVNRTYNPQTIVSQMMKLYTS